MYKPGMCVCCTALMKPNQAEPALSAVAHSLVPHNYCIHNNYDCVIVSYYTSLILLVTPLLSCCVLRSPVLSGPTTSQSANKQLDRTEASGGMTYDLKIENIDIAYGHKYVHLMVCQLYTRIIQYSQGLIYWGEGGCSSLILMVHFI